MKQTVKQSGFTLAEIAIVLAVIGIAMTMGLKMLTATLENGAISETQAKQERIKLALVSYLRTNGRLPCPDTATPATGNELTPCIDSVALGYGVPPWLTLQLSRDAVIDGWGNFFSYRVANNQPAAVLRNWTSRTVGTPFDINELTTPNVALIIQERTAPAAALTQITDRAVFVILSHGKYGLGALTTRGAAIPPSLRVFSFSGIGRHSTSSLPMCCTGAASSLSAIAAKAASRSGRESENIRTLISPWALSPASASL